MRGSEMPVVPHPLKLNLTRREKMKLEDIEEARISDESVLLNLKKKHQDAIQELSEQIDQDEIQDQKG